MSGRHRGGHDLTLQNVWPGAAALVLMASGCGSTASTGSPAPLAISFDAPVEGAATNGPLDISIHVTGAPPDRVVIDVDGTNSLTLAPPFRTQLDTRNLSEGWHLLHAGAASQDGGSGSADRAFTVDRTPPGLVDRWPATGAEVGSSTAGVVLTFDEPLLLSSLDAGAVVLEQAGVPVPLSPVLSEGGRILTLSPAAVPQSPRPVDVTFHAAAGFATDLAGNPVPSISGRWTIPFWEEVGGPINPFPANGLTGYPQLALRSDGGPLVGLSTYSPANAGDLWVEEWTGARWSPLVGDAGAFTVPVTYSVPLLGSLIVDPQGRPVAAFSGEDDQRRGYARFLRWSGSGWEPLGQPLLLPSWVYSSHLTTDSAGTLWTLLGVDSAGYQDWYVFRWDGAAWNAVGGRVNESGAWAAAGGDIRISAQGVPHVVFSQSGTVSNGTMVHVWNGTAWSILGGEIHRAQPGASAQTSPRLELDSQGRPVVLTEEFFDQGWSSLGWHWTGQAWAPLGQPVGAPVPYVAPLPSGGLSLGPGDVPSVAVIRLDGGVPTAQLYELDASTWVPVGPGLVARSPWTLGMGRSGVQLARDAQGRRLLLVSGCSTGVCNPFLFRETR